MATHSSTLAWRIPGMGGAWLGSIYGIAQSRTWLKWLSSSSSRKQGKPADSISPFSPSLIQITSISKERACTHNWHPDFVAAIGGIGPQIAWCHSQQGLHFLVHRTTAHKKEVLNGYRSYQPCAYTHRPSIERTGKKKSYQFLLGRVLTTYFSSIYLGVQPSNQPECRCWLKSSRLGHWQVLTHPQVLGGSLKTKKVTGTVTKV